MQVFICIFTEHIYLLNCDTGLQNRSYGFRSTHKLSLRLTHLICRTHCDRALQQNMVSHTIEAWKKIELLMWVNRYSSNWIVWQLLESQRGKSSKERKLGSQMFCLQQKQSLMDCNTVLNFLQYKGGKTSTNEHMAFINASFTIFTQVLFNPDLES